MGHPKQYKPIERYSLGRISLLEFSRPHIFPLCRKRPIASTPTLGESRLVRTPSLEACPSSRSFQAEAGLVDTTRLGRAQRRRVASCLSSSIGDQKAKRAASSAQRAAREARRSTHRSASRARCALSDLEGGRWPRSTWKRHGSISRRVEAPPGRGRTTSMFYVYENWTVEKARVHRAECPFCNDGRGMHPGASNRNGRWHGPFASRQQAAHVAQKTGRPVSSCGHCNP